MSRRFMSFCLAIAFNMVLMVSAANARIISIETDATAHTIASVSLSMTYGNACEADGAVQWGEPMWTTGNNVVASSIWEHYRTLCTREYQPVYLSATHKYDLGILNPGVYSFNFNFDPTNWPPNAKSENSSFGTVAVPTGSNVSVSPIGGNLMKFSTVVEEGTALIASISPRGAPPNFRVITGASYSISSTASYSGDIIIGLKYNDSALLSKINEGRIKIFHHNGTNWEDVTTSIDTVNKIVYGKVTSLSPFILAEPTTTIPPVPVGGLGASLITMASIIAYGARKFRK